MRSFSTLLVSAVALYATSSSAAAIEARQDWKTEPISEILAEWTSAWRAALDTTTLERRKTTTVTLASTTETLVPDSPITTTVSLKHCLADFCDNTLFAMPTGCCTSVTTAGTPAATVATTTKTKKSKTKKHTKTKTTTTEASTRTPFRPISTWIDPVSHSGFDLGTLFTYSSSLPALSEPSPTTLATKTRKHKSKKHSVASTTSSSSSNPTKVITKSSTTETLVADSPVTKTFTMDTCFTSLCGNDHFILPAGCCAGKTAS